MSTPQRSPASWACCASTRRWSRRDLLGAKRRHGMARCLPPLSCSQIRPPAKIGELGVTERSTETVAIIGAGVGGLYLVAELGIAGFKLRLHDIDDTRLSEI